MPNATRTIRDIFASFLRLGLTSFGGPVAHLGYFHREFVERRRWIGAADYAEVVALCQFLPGPASSQVGIALGLRWAGFTGALAAWLGFTLPSALLMLGAAYGLHALPAGAAGALAGLGLVALAVVALAVMQMARRLLAGARRWGVAAIAAALVLALPGTRGQLAALAAGALLGMALLHDASAANGESPDAPRARRRHALLALGLFFALLLGLPWLAALTGNGAIARASAFYRAGSLVFGGGHVVLPLLEGATVPQGWIGRDAFLAGYGLAQALPGPLFAFAAYLGAAIATPPNGAAGAALALVAIYLPSFLLLAGVLPFWQRLGHLATARRALAGLNAAVVGLLAATWVSPLATGSLRGPRDALLVLAAFALLAAARLPSWLVVVLGAAAGALWL
ncbi:MAG: chromate efflux transporter [Mizugakiibacter sp.]|uniref:chromate efflux transporter n=1 Tax=Mizugakiibacter sp. TaxID=1972610 RepID=UPI0031C5E67B|nr:chromate efflux transporter [Xanthomonadaceae bacterium]